MYSLKQITSYCSSDLRSMKHTQDIQNPVIAENFSGMES